MNLAEATMAAGRRAALFCTLVAACTGSVTSVMVPPALARPSEVFHGPDGVLGLLYPPEAGAPPSAAVLVVNDALGMDTRSHRYIDHLTAAGLMVLEVELRENPLDGLAEPLPGEPEAASLVARAAAVLADDPRVNPTRIGALGFGIGARALALAPPRQDGRDALAARVLLYPGCGSLTDLVQAPERAAATVLSPVLLLHGEDDPANLPAACEELSVALGKAAPVRRISFRGASYAWDLPQIGEGEYSRQPWPGGLGTIIVRSWPELAELTAAQAAAFLADTLSREEVP
ncbi:MAG TPA: dienelactone hydrolase family protein [Crenalkalicoccus sp.]|jgi:dienelactone hydrolase|nr:dienelactone hydrolase family protein [Crenalkalicoccus sp.]